MAALRPKCKPAPVNRAIQAVKDSGLRHEVGSMWTKVEGSWPDCLQVLNSCRKAVEDQDRLEIHAKFDIRTSAQPNRIRDKVEAVESSLEDREEEEKEKDDS